MLPNFLSRIHNAAGPLLGGIASSELGERLLATTIRLETGEEQVADPGQRAAFLLAVNLAARLYPRLSLVAPDDLAGEAEALARGINPAVELGEGDGRVVVLSWLGGEPTADRVTVAAEAWNVSLDRVDPAAPAQALAAMAAAALGIGEAFRAVFADLLEEGRSAPVPFTFNLVSFGEPVELPALPKAVELGEIHLAGCGAIGQAVVATLAELPVAGTLHAVDHDPLDEGNLQRYLLAGAGDPGKPKPELVERALAGSELKVERVETLWGADERTAPGRGTVLAALDTKQGRIELQGGLPREIFNAWTRHGDLGVSRHQSFGGEQGCLACLYWPNRPRPNETELIAEALAEDELRVASYLLSGTPVGVPLPAEAIGGTVRLPPPSDPGPWTSRSLLADLIERFSLPAAEFEPLAGLDVRGLYRDAVCAGMMIEHGAERGAEVSVPLAHQSALAGILLATALVVDRVPELRAARPERIVARYDVLRGGAQGWTRPTGREPRCICSDPDFLTAWEKRWGA
jgi:ThiF family